jgi:putative membrane protein
MRILILLLLTVFVCMAGCTPAANVNSTVTTNTNSNANANVARPSPTAPPATAAVPDARTFAFDVAQSNMAEIALARLAAQKGQSADVKRFAQRVIADHSKVLAELKQTAATKNITLPADVKPEQKQTHDRIAALSGPAFDREFMAAMVEGHDKSVKTFQAVANNGTDAEFKAWAAKVLPTLEQHQKMAHDIHSKLGT